jgi:hypothetical protein
VLSDANSVLYSITGGHNFTAIIVATMAAHVVRALQFPTIAALCISLRGERMMAAAHTTA